MVSFGLFKSLRRPRRKVTRCAASFAAWTAIWAITNRPRLAKDAARRFEDGDWVSGAHFLRWYWAHGWPGQFGAAQPAFSPALQMDASCVPVLDDWLASRKGDAARLGRLSVLAKLAHETQGKAQQEVLDAFERMAQSLLPLAEPNFAIKPSPKNEFSLDAAKAALDSLLEHLHLPWYIISGTFLGAVREGTFLSHDYDIDIGIDASAFDEAQFLAQIDAASDLVFVTASPARRLVPRGDGFDEQVIPALYCLMHRTGIEIDVFLHHREGARVWHGSGKHRWDNSPFDLKIHRLAGREVFGPGDEDRYLTENYGDWRTPKKHFDCSIGTTNVSFQRNLFAVAEFMRSAKLNPSTADAAIAILVLRAEGYLTQNDQRFTLPWRRPQDTH